MNKTLKDVSCVDEKRQAATDAEPRFGRASVALFTLSKLVLYRFMWARPLVEAAQKRIGIEWPGLTTVFYDAKTEKNAHFFLQGANLPECTHWNWEI